jgi:uncharacterized membrane protein YebE (DUF533 family)
MSVWDDMVSGPALSGAVAGGTSGAMVGGGWGALAGGLIGLGSGAYMDYKRNQANDSAKKNQAQLIQEIQGMNRASYQQHIADLNKALSFYAVPQAYWQSEYGSGMGTGASAPTLGGGAWSNTGVK